MSSLLTRNSLTIVPFSKGWINNLWVMDIFLASCFIYHCQISLLNKEKYNGSSHNSDESTNYDETAMPLGQGGQKNPEDCFI